jgi:hypothetical protein
VSEATVGGTTKRHRVVTTIIGLIVAPAVTGAAIVIGLIIVSLIMGYGGSIGVGGPGNMAFLIMGVIFGATFGLIPSILVGLPLHHYFVHMKWNRALHYAALGAGIAPAALLLMTLVFLSGQGTWLNLQVALTFLLIAFAGAVGGLTFWIIRRPDRDTPPIPDEVFA